MTQHSVEIKRSRAKLHTHTKESSGKNYKNGKIFFTVHRFLFRLMFMQLSICIFSQSQPGRALHSHAVEGEIIMQVEVKSQFNSLIIIVCLVYFFYIQPKYFIVYSTCISLEEVVLIQLLSAGAATINKLKFLVAAFS